MLSLPLALACAHRLPEPVSEDAVAIAVGANEGYVALGSAGFATFDLHTGAHGSPTPPPPPMESVDGLSLLNEVLALLDARTPGAFALTLPAEGLRLSAGPTPVALRGPAGLSTHHGVAAVVGGSLTVLTYDGRGELGAERTVAPLPGAATGVILHHTGERAYVLGALEDGQAGLQVLRLQAPPGEPLPLATLALCEDDPAPRGQAIDEHLVLSCGSELWVVDLADPASPQILSRTELGPGLVAAAGELDRAYALGARELVELDLSDPAAPALLERLPLPEAAVPHDLTVRKGTVYVAAGPAGVLVFPRREAPDATRAQ